MSNTISPNMGLIIPGVGSEAGPTYATDVNTSLSTIDGHSHVTGSGVLITTAALNINTDLTFNSTNAYNLKTVRFTSLSGTIANAAPNLGCLYVAGNELYYNDFTGGNIIAITNNGSVNAGAGSITGLPSGTASVTFSASVYVFKAATSTPASIDCGSVIFRNTIASSHDITVSPPAAIGANYSLTWPALPASKLIMALDSSGNMSAPYSVDGSTIQIIANAITVATGGITATQIANNAITNTQIAAATITAAKLVNATLTGTQIASNINLAGKAVQEGGANLVVCNSNDTNSLSMLRGILNSDASVYVGSGFTTAKGSTGNYTVNFTSAFGDTPAFVVTSITTQTFGYVTAGSSSSFTIQFISWSGGNATDTSFSFTATGQRA